MRAPAPTRRALRRSAEAPPASSLLGRGSIYLSKYIQLSIYLILSIYLSIYLSFYQADVCPIKLTRAAAYRADARSYPALKVARRQPRRRPLPPRP